MFILGEQHKSIGKTRLKRDIEDTENIISRLTEISPYNENEFFINITNGSVADKSANVDDFYSLGSTVVSKMYGQNIFEYTFKRKDKVKTMSSKTKIDKKNEIEIDPALLFQRLLVVANASTISPNDVFSYELCSYPPAIFESSIMLRKGDKPKIVESIVNHVSSTLTNTECKDVTNTAVKYVLDRGSLLHRKIGEWNKNSSYLDIANAYVEFVKADYGEAIIVFDGYMSGPSTKDNTHLRRSTKGVSRLINFSPEMKFQGNKSSFLVNVRNKTKIIQLIGSQLEKENCKVVYAEEDADVDVAVIACNESMSNNVIVVGEDSDLLVLLLYYSTFYDSAFNLTFKSDLTKSKYPKGHNIFRYRDVLGPNASDQLLFVHGFSGCDTTSSFFHIGKSTVFY